MQESNDYVSIIIFQFITIYMLQNNGLYVCENKIIEPFYVILYFNDLKFFKKTKIWNEIHDKCMIFYKTFSLNL